MYKSAPTAGSTPAFDADNQLAISTYDPYNSVVSIIRFAWISPAIMVKRDCQNGVCISKPLT